MKKAKIHRIHRRNLRQDGPRVFVFLLAVIAGLQSSTAGAQQSVGETTDQQVEVDFQIAQYRFPIRLPDGFRLESLTTDLELPRIIHFAGSRMFIGSRSGKVYWMDPPYDKPNILIELDEYPHSVVIQDGYIFIAETNRITYAPWTPDVTSLSSRDMQLLVELPGGRGHNSRTLKAGPDGRLYVSLGIRGNCSDEFLDESYPAQSRRGGVYILSVERGDGNQALKGSLEPFAAGLRNPVGLDWQPGTNVLYASNNGPDHWGYEQPREYLSKLEAGSFHGMPWFQYVDDAFVRDACINSSPPRPVAQVSKPVARFPARIAPMDMVFLADDAEAQPYRGDALVALHGSWATADGGSDGDPASRREPAIVRVSFSDSNGETVGTVHEFLSGFQLPNGSRWARPVGIATGPDGQIYFTSDAGLQGLYRLVYAP
jgi:glucose/arabinose dehydrogenase